MEKLKSFMLIMLVTLMGGVITSCGDDDEENNGNGGLASYTLNVTISDKGTLPDVYYQALQASFQRVSTNYDNVSVEVAKAALDEALKEAIKNDSFVIDNYNYTIEFYIADSSGNKVYSRYIIVKDGKATLS